MVQITSRNTGEVLLEVSRANLCGANLYGADLRGADLRGANLWRANLSEANLYGADLRGANLFGANLYRADLREANLNGANLYGADLCGADLYRATLYGADLREANLNGARGAVCLGTDPRGYRFVGIRHDDGWRVLAGSLWFTVDEAKEHWGRRGNKDALARVAALQAHNLTTSRGL